jgi:predicted PurR-regulated permease PerM
MAREGDDGRRGVPNWLERAAGWSWRLLVVAAATAVVVWLLGKLWAVFLPLVVAVFLTRVLARPNEALRDRGTPHGVAAAIVLVGFLVLGAGSASLIGMAVAGETDQIGPTVSDAVDDLEDWLVEDSPFDVDRNEIDEFRADAGDRVKDTLETSSGSLVSGALLVVEVFISLILGLIITFFALKDGSRFIGWVRGLLPEPRRELADRLANRAWRTLGGYFRGAALLGLVEGAIIGLTLMLVGAHLAVPMAVVTFLAAFVPFVGAIVAGALATLVALATAGTAEAVIVLVVAVVVQQLDNDVLAPVVYGRALNLHPVLVLLAITGGGAMFGIAGSFLAVPVVAVAVNVINEALSAPDSLLPDQPEAGSGSASSV